MTGLALVLLSHTWLPLTSADDIAHRYEVAAAIEAVTRDEGERRALMVFAAEESHFARDVADCRRTGDNGHAVTSWQIHVYGATRALVCGSLVEAARHALWMLRASRAACAHRPEAERWAFYASGSCDRGRAISRRRWWLTTKGWR